MASIWNENVILRFNRVPPNPKESDYHAPYNKLLTSEFPPTSKFTVVPQAYPIRSTKNIIDFYVEYTVEVDDKPVLIIEVEEPSQLGKKSARQSADLQIRERLADTIDICPLDNLYGISAFGTSISFYNISKDTQEIQPRGIERHPELMTDSAPLSWWSDNILERQGASKLKQLFNQIMDKCDSL